MNDKPFFSIITVTKNCREELLLTTKSLFLQSFTDFEWIIKDGVSTDQTLECLPDDRRIRTIVREDSGIYNAMNQAFPFATGRYVIFLNAGDYFLDSEMLATIHEKALEKPGKILYTDFYHSRHRCFIEQEDNIDKYYFYRGTINHQSIFFPLSLIKQENHKDKLYNEAYKIAGDYDLLIRLYINRVPFEHIRLNMVYYDSGLSGSKEGNRIRKVEYRLIQSEYYSIQEKVIYFIMKNFNRLCKKLCVKK